MEQEFIEDYDYYFDLEKGWRKALPKYSDKELLSLFPGSKEVIPKKIKEWKARLNESERELKEYLSAIYSQTSDEFTVWFWEQVAKTFLMPDVMEAEKHILRLNRMMSISSPVRGKEKGLENWREKVEIARQYPIYDIANCNLELRQCGDKFLSRCPFHNEKHASFYIYTATNSFYCFGCCEGGDAIKLTMHLHGVDFKDAIAMLQN